MLSWASSLNLSKKSEYEPLAIVDMCFWLCSLLTYQQSMNIDYECLKNKGKEAVFRSEKGFYLSNY